MKWEPVTALSVFGIINLLLLLFGLRFFISVLFPKDRSATAFYALLFVTTLWGKDAWGYSGFFHLRVLGYVLPYPSTFSMALTFMTLPIYARLMKDRNRMWLIPIIASTVTVLLTHPITFIFLAVGILSLSMADPSFSWRKYSLLAGFFFLVMFLGVLWPYYPVIQLLGSESKAYHPSNRVMYSSFIRRILPALIGVLVLLVRIRLNWRDSLGMMLILLIFIFACGWILNRWSYGRVISHIAIVLQIAVASGSAWLESKLRWDRIPVFCTRIACCVLVLLLISWMSFESYVRPAINQAKPGLQNTYNSYQFLSGYTRQYDVILSDMNSSWILPTFGGKVIAAQHPLAFIPDHQTRVKDVNRFFQADYQDQMEIVRRYNVGFVLIDKKRIPEWLRITDSLQLFSHKVFENQQFILIHLRLVAF